MKRLESKNKQFSFISLILIILLILCGLLLISYKINKDYTQRKNQEIELNQSINDLLNRITKDDEVLHYFGESSECYEIGSMILTNNEIVNQVSGKNYGKSCYYTYHNKTIRIVNSEYREYIQSLKVLTEDELKEYRQFDKYQEDYVKTGNESLSKQINSSRIKNN